MTASIGDHLEVSGISIAFEEPLLAPSVLLEQLSCLEDLHQRGVSKVPA